MEIFVLGPVRVTADDHPVAVGSRRRRELLGRLVAADGQAVPLAVLMDDLWEDPPSGAAGTIRTFVSELRRSLEPERSPRTPSRLIETVGTGYALRISRRQVDVHRFEDDLRVARDGASGQVARTLTEALSWWVGEPYADLGDSPWVTRERFRLAELRQQAVESHARAMLDLGNGTRLVPRLEAVAASHPWREQVWVLLSQALYQAGRQVDALGAIRKARAALLDQFGLAATTNLDHLERDILRHAPHLTGAAGDGTRLGLLTRTEASGIYTRLRSMSTVAKAAAMTGGTNLVLAQTQRAQAVAEAERTGNPDMTARVIAAYDVPTIWTRSDDQAQANALVETTRRTLDRLGPAAPSALRARLLATIALEHRGSRDRWAAEAAFEAERLARDLRDPVVLALALNARFVQSFQRPGRAQERDALATELIDLATRHDLPAFEILGHLIKLQVHAASGDLEAARPHVAAAERLATSHETPLVHVLVGGFRAMTLAERSSDLAMITGAYREVAADLAGAGMPGLAGGLVPLALLSSRLRRGLSAPTAPELDWGPCLPWVQPLLHRARDDFASARRAVAKLPLPRADHLYDALWAVNAHTAVSLDDESLAHRAIDALRPFRGGIAGGTTAMITFGAVDDIVAMVERHFGERAQD